MSGRYDRESAQSASLSAIRFHYYTQQFECYSTTTCTRTNITAEPNKPKQRMYKRNLIECTNDIHPHVADTHISSTRNVLDVCERPALRLYVAEIHLLVEDFYLGE